MVSREQIEALANIDDLSDRLEAAARLCTGNIVEIGGGEGINTIRFLKVAKDRNTKVIVIDPFEQIPGADESYFKPYSIERFMMACAQFGSRLHLIRKSSQDPEAWIEVRAFEPIGFVYVDGLQDRNSVFSDLKTSELLDVEIICIDDYDRSTESSQVPLGVEDFIGTTNYQFIDIGKREAYFIK